MLPSLPDCVSAAFDVALVVGLINRFAGKNAEANGDDELVAGAHDYILDAAANADRAGKGAACTGHNYRDGLTIEQAEALRQEADLRRMGNRN